MDRMGVNRKLKAIYFVWGDEYYAPFPRSWDDTFEHYLELTRYDFADDWQQKIMDECGIKTKEEYDEQILLIDEQYTKYRAEQWSKFERRANKKQKIFNEKCRKEGVLPF